MMSAFPPASARISNCEFHSQTNFLLEIYVKISFYFHIFSFFIVFNHDFKIYIDFTRIAASNTATDDVTN